MFGLILCAQFFFFFTVVEVRSKPTLIYKAELVDLALDMIKEDFRPLADALGVTGSKFTSYRQDFRSSHLGLGTISLLLTLVNLIDNASFITPIRRSLSSILDKAGYPTAMRRFNFGKKPLFLVYQESQHLCYHMKHYKQTMQQISYSWYHILISK